MRRAALIAMSAFLVPQLALAESYLCVTEKASGFVYNKQQRDWQPAVFKPNRKYVIRRPIEDDFANEDTKWIIAELGETYPLARCDEEINEYGFLNCRALGGDFRFNEGTLRFIRSYVIGYHTSGREGFPDEEADTPVLQIGTCTRLD